jgi:hypothetical protein
MNAVLKAGSLSLISGPITPYERKKTLNNFKYAGVSAVVGF